MRIGLNACYHGPNSPEDLNEISSWGPMTIRAAVASADQARAILDACDAARPTPIRVLALVENINPGLVHDLGDLLVGRPDTGVELGNETNLAGVAATDFGAFVRESYQKLRARGFEGEVWSGGVSDCRRAMIEYLTTAGAVEWPVDLGVAVHRYPEDPWTQDPTPGQGQTRGPGDPRARWLEQAELVALVGNRPRAVTEFGYHYELQFDGWGDRRRSTILSEAQGAAYAAADLSWFHAMGVDLAVLYQWTDGDQVLDAGSRFGVRKTDGTLRERMVDTLSAWARRDE